MLSLCLAILQGSTPLSTYGTYFGGVGDDRGTAVTTDSQGNVVIAGWTTSQTLPGTGNAFPRILAAGSSVPIAVKVGDTFATAGVTIAIK